MLNKCINLRYRKHKGVIYCYCTKRRAVIESFSCSSCIYREYKKAAKIAFKSRNNTITKKTAITKDVKMKVWARDNCQCIFCGQAVSWNYANSHYIKRSQLGLGIEENIMTNCSECHRLFEESPQREKMKAYARKYFMSLYVNWNEKDLKYKKER